jgi:hypothetical protein
MGARDDKIAKYIDENAKLGLGLTDDLITKVTVGLGPSIHKKDAETVSCSDEDELDRVKQNYLIKKLGCEDSPQLDEAIKDVCAKMGSSNRNKYRALFYALLASTFNKESVYA